jgi:hypothetical protein
LTQGEVTVYQRVAIGSLLLAAVLALAAESARAADNAKYPNMTGQWIRMGSGSYDPKKPSGLGQQAPLTPEYQTSLETSVASVAAGGQGNNPMGACIPPGMPRTMINYEGLEVVVTPDITYILLQEPMDQIRRIYTDGRPWPDNIEPAFLGYSIGHWVDDDGDGRYDALVVETRGLKLPRVYDSSGIPFDKDGQAVVQERISLDKSDPNVLHDEITTIDHALTHPWTVVRDNRRAKKAIWVESVCTEENHQIKIGKEYYYISADGNLMPTRKDQPPPSLTNFGQAAK